MGKINIPETVQERRKFLKSELSKYKDKLFYCKSLDCNVLITDKSIIETSFYAASNIISTKLALRLPEIIQNASILNLHLPPKFGRQTKIMKFIEIANLICEVKRIGVAKLTVGYTIKGECIEYAITAFSVTKKTKN